MQRVRSSGGAHLVKLATPWTVARTAPLRKIRRATQVSVAPVPRATGLRRVDFQEFERTEAVCTPERSSWAAVLWRGGWCALLLALSFLPWTTSALQPKAEMVTERVTMTVHGRAASLSLRVVQSSLSKVSIQPPVLRFTALVGSAMLARSAMLKWRCSATMAEMESSATEDEEELDPSPAKPVIFALGLASAVVDTFRVDMPKQPYVSRPRRLKTSYPTHLDIDGEEYDALASILKRTKESSMAHAAKLDPIRRLLTAPQAYETPKTPFKQFIEKLEEKTDTDISFLRKFIMRLTRRGRGKYDCMTDLAAFEVPSAEAGMLRAINAPSDNKFDFLVGLLKGKWRAPTRADTPYWDPRSLLFMLTEQPAVHDLNGARLIRKLGDFSEDRSNPSDPVEGMSTNSQAEDSHKHDPISKALNGVQEPEMQQSSLSITSSPSATQSARPKHAVEKDKDATEANKMEATIATGQEKESLPMVSDEKQNKESDTKTVAGIQSSSATDSPISIPQQIDEQAHVPPPARERELEDQKQISAQLQQIEKHLDRTSLLAEGNKQTTQSTMGKDVEQLKNRQPLNHEPSKTNGSMTMKSMLRRPAARRVQETMRQITSELTQVSHEITKLCH